MVRRMEPKGALLEGAQGSVAIPRDGTLLGHLFESLVTLSVRVYAQREVTHADVRHLLWLKGKAGAELFDAIVVTSGPVAYRRKDGIGVVPAALLGP